MNTLEERPFTVDAGWHALRAGRCVLADHALVRFKMISGEWFEGQLDLAWARIWSAELGHVALEECRGLPCQVEELVSL